MARIRKSTKSIAQEPQIWNAALYIRLSKEDGNDVSISVSNQKNMLCQFIDQNCSELQLYDTYIDDGYTGTDSNRENFQRMLKDIRERKVDCVIVKDVSRLSRNYIEAGMYLETLFVQMNVRFISLTGPALDSYKNPEQMTSIAVPIQNVINDDFCKQTSMKIRRTFDYKRSVGDFIGAFAPYGYAKSSENHNRLVIDDEAAGVVKDIYSWFVDEGMSKAGIAKRLIELGVPNPATYKRSNGFNYNNPHNKFKESYWTASTVTKILQNKLYLGHMVQGKQKVKSYKIHDRVCIPENEWFTVENTHEAMIDQATFDTAQSLQTRETRTAPNQKTVHLFSGFIRCSDCGRAMSRKHAKDKIYFSCRTYNEQSKERCTKHSIREDVLEKAVLAAIQVHLNLVLSMSDTIDQISTAPSSNNKSIRLDALYKNRKHELEKAKGMNDSLYFDLKSGLISTDEFKRLKTKITADIEQLEQVVKNIELEREDVANGIKPDHPYLAHFLKFQNIIALDRAIMVELIDSIRVHEGGDITIKFRFADQFLRLLEYIENNKKELTIICSRTA